jgi:outer membrane protein
MLKSARLFALAMIVAKVATGQDVSFTGPAPGSQSTSLDSSTGTSEAGGPIEGSRWSARVGLVGVIYHSGATISISRAVVPGATVDVSHDVSLTLDITYDVTKNLFTSLMVGIPPKPTITGRGTASPLGELGTVRYGPAVLSGGYRFRRRAAFQPYVATGIAYAIIFKDHDGSVSDLHVRNNFGFVLQIGAEYSLSRKWSVFADFKEIWLAVDAQGLIGSIPTTAHVNLNPSLVSVGFTHHF